MQPIADACRPRNGVGTCQARAAYVARRQSQGRSVHGHLVSSGACHKRGPASSARSNGAHCSHRFKEKTRPCLTQTGAGFSLNLNLDEADTRAVCACSDRHVTFCMYLSLACRVGRMSTYVRGCVHVAIFAHVPMVVERGIKNPELIQNPKPRQ